MSTHVEVRRKLKDIADIHTFNELLDSLAISEEDKVILKLHYLECKDFRYIGDKLGYSESWMIARHRKILKKVGKLLK